MTPAWIDSLQAKDWITLGVSLSAFAFSVVTYRQKRGDAKQAQRKQLTDLLKELSDLNLKAETFRALKDKFAHPRNYLGLLNDQRRFVVRQAETVSREINTLVSAFEYILMAEAFNSIDYAEEAENLFLEAIRRASSNIESGIAQRGYGRFLSFSFATIRRALDSKPLSMFLQKLMSEAAFTRSIHTFDGQSSKRSEILLNMPSSWRKQGLT